MWLVLISRPDLRLLSLGTFLSLAAGTAAAQPNPSGVWQVEGRDEIGTDWKAVLVLETNDADVYPPRKFKGYFDWEGSNGINGREYLSDVVYDYDSRKLAMRGGELEDADCRLRSSIYAVRMTEAADRLVDGNWKGEDVNPGVFAGKRLLELPGKKKRVQVGERKMLAR
jgi:hypothetical protein